MRRICFVFVVTLLTGHMAYAQKTITIKGKVQFLNPEKSARFNKVWLGHRDGGDFNIIDSVILKSDGLWQFKVDASKPKFYDIDIVKWDRATIWADVDMTINCRGYDTAKMKIKNPPYIFIEGSADNNFINLVNHANYRNYQTMIAASQEMYRADLAKDTTWAGYLKRQDPYKQLSADFYDRLKVLIRAYQDRPVVLYGIKMLNWEREKDFILPILDNLEKKNSWFTDVAKYKKDVLEKIAQANRLKPGMPIPVVAYNDPDGKPVSINAYKGKYLLIDFWASWCGPCRQSIPKVKALYEKYGPSGFDVLSISIDDSDKAWRKAMLDEEMPWKQVLSPDKKATMQTFLFSGIPTLYLVDKEGNIIKSFTGFTDDIDGKFKTIFGK